MLRRTFIKTLASGAALALLPSFAIPRRRLRFGVVTDSHFARKAIAGNRFYDNSLAKMQQAVDYFNRAGLDFIIELGDLKDMGPTSLWIDGHEQKRSQQELEAEALGYLVEIEQVFKSFRGPAYHVLGNHDMDCISKEQFLAHTKNPGKANGKAHYSFLSNGIRLIVLDGNFNADRTPYCRGNFDWQVAYVSDEQLRWLDNELKTSKEPVVVFCHQLVDSFSGLYKSIYLSNADEVRSTLERYGNVMAVMQGHHHPGHYSEQKGIHYITFPGMIESEFPKHNNFAIVTIEADNTIKIEGYGDCPSRKVKNG